ncbi:helix-turn-helix transcriptional regulator [Kibdelosporangium persicum]|uniref:Winged helix-turn-helix transcriptional regulator n=1 Tax=Kibdelosporangium persicum TaxID=2698649 RepID=A0ABX2F372_9PSEU|nr:Winged helix-turn-helix transcriptional regulator [Kibdelosporangium persicum]
MPDGADLPDDDAVAVRVVLVCRALANPVRVRLLSLLRAAPGGEACVGELIESVGVSQSTVSHHLRVLVDAGLVRSARRGHWVWYSPRSDQLDVIDFLLR